MFCDKDIIKFDELIEKVIYPDELIVAKHLSHTKNSYYVTVLKKPNRFMNIRISDHPTLKNYVRYFNIIYDDDYKENIQKMGRVGKRKKINYILFVALSIIDMAKTHHVVFHIDDIYGTFSNETAPPAFLYEFGKYKNRHLFPVPLALSDAMTGLYKYGFITIFNSQYGNTEVSLTSGGKIALKLLENLYGDYWQIHKKKLDWFKVNIPKEVITLSIEMSLRDKEQRKQLLLEKETVAQLPFWKKIFFAVINYMKKIFSKKYCNDHEFVQNNNELDITDTHSEGSNLPVIDNSEVKKEEKKRHREQFSLEINKRKKYKMKELIDEETIRKLEQLKKQLD